MYRFILTARPCEDSNGTLVPVGVEKILAIVVEVVVVVAELTVADAEILMTQIIEDTRKLAALKAYAEAA